MKIRMTVLVISIFSMAFASTMATGASRWHELFLTTGTGNDRDSGCDNAQSGAWGAVGYSSACMLRRGSKADEEFKNCRCTQIGNTYSCQMDIKVTCESWK
jgi:hypothetical protein